MKLLQYTNSKLTILLFFIISIWGILLYFAMQHEIMDETDDMLRSYRDIFIKKALSDTSLLNTAYETAFDRYSISTVSIENAERYKESWYDEEIYFPEESEDISVRVFKSIFLAPDNQYYELEVKIPTVERDDMIETLIMYLICLFVLLLICVFIGNWIILSKSFSPLKKLLLWINTIIPGKPVPPLNNYTKIVEFKQLNNAVYTMSQRNFQVYEEQKQFIENAAHELQTPIAVALSKIELLSQDEQITEKQLSEIDQIYRSLNQSVRLNKSLLLLSRIENKQFTNSINVDINSLIYDASRDLSEIYEYKNIDFIVENKELCNVEMNEILSRILATNLLKNAFIHTMNKGRIVVIIDENKLVVKNTGEKSLDKEKMFNRFYQAAGKKENSTGLGLSIIKSICELYKFSLRYEFLQEHIFIISFK